MNQQRSAELAAKGVFLGTSSWKYPLCRAPHKEYFHAWMLEKRAKISFLGEYQMRVDIPEAVRLFGRAEKHGSVNSAYPYYLGIYYSGQTTNYLRPNSSDLAKGIDYLALGATNHVAGCLQILKTMLNPADRRYNAERLRIGNVVAGLDKP